MHARSEHPPASSRDPAAMGFSFQEDLWFGDFDDDVAREAAASSMAAMAGRVMGARPFPAAAQRLVQLTRNPQANIHKVVRVLESDPGLSQRVLRLVNSAGYGLRVRCTSLNHATALLGQNRLQQIATSAVLLNHFGRTSDETKRKQEHGALVASLCRYLAIHLGLPQEDLFTCGLLHDLGQLMMLDDGDKNYLALVNAHQGQWDALHISEREVLGFDHAVLAAHVLASWSIPAPVPEVIALHHQPALAHQRGAKISAMVQTLRFADHMSHLLDDRSESEGAKELADSEAASYLGFSEMQISAMWKDLRQLSDANRSRRMDIADIAPRSLDVPPSLTPREQAITDAPMPLSHHPISPTDPAPTYSDRCPPAESTLPRNLPLSGGPLPLSSGDENVLKLDHATPVAHVDSMPTYRTLSVEPPTVPDRNESLDEDDRPSQASAEPEVFPCAICYGPTFGACCPVCTAHVCSAHQTSERQWCVACDAEFGRYTSEHRVNRIVRIATITAISVAVSSSGLLLGWQAGFGVLGICLTAALAAYAAYQGYLKAQFKKDRGPTDEAPPTLLTPHHHIATLSGIRLSEDEEQRTAQELDAISETLHEEPERSRADGPGALDLEPTHSGSHPSGATDSKVVVHPDNDDAPKSPLISAHPISRSTLDLGSLPPVSEEAAEKSRHMAQETVPAPSIARARALESGNLEEPSPADSAAWPPSQEPPGTSRRTSFLPSSESGDAPRIRFSEPPRSPTLDAVESPSPFATPALESEATEQSIEDRDASSPDPYKSDPPDRSHPQAIAPPSMNGEEPELRSEAHESTPEPHEELTHLQGVSEPSTVPNIAFSSPQCEPATLSAVITPPVIVQPGNVCTAPSGTVKITPLDLHSDGAPQPGNDQNQRAASEN